MPRSEARGACWGQCYPCDGAGATVATRCTPEPLAARRLICHCLNSICHKWKFWYRLTENFRDAFALYGISVPTGLTILMNSLTVAHYHMQSKDKA